MMSDLRGFTSIAEGLTPEQVLQAAQHYLGAMADVISAHQGTIDEFIGDAILVIFGAPGRSARRRAPRGGLRGRDAARDGRGQPRQRAPGCPELEMGIALHTGEVIVGNIGSERRTKYGVVGSAVNLAGRIESFTVGGQVLISDATLREAGDAVRGSASRSTPGTREPIVVYDLRGVGARTCPARRTACCRSRLR